MGPAAVAHPRLAHGPAARPPGLSLPRRRRARSAPKPQPEHTASCPAAASTPPAPTLPHPRPLLSPGQGASRTATHLRHVERTAVMEGTVGRLTCFSCTKNSNSPGGAATASAPSSRMLSPLARRLLHALSPPLLSVTARGLLGSQHMPSSPSLPVLLSGTAPSRAAAAVWPGGGADAQRSANPPLARPSWLRRCSSSATAAAAAGLLPGPTSQLRRRSRSSTRWQRRSAQWMAVLMASAT